VPLADGVRKPVQRVGRAGGAAASKLGGGPSPKACPTRTFGSVRLSVGAPLNSGVSNTSASSPGAPVRVESAEVGTGTSGRRYVVPGSNATRVFGNCFRMPSSAVVEREGQPL